MSYVCNVHNGLIIKPRLPKTMISKIGGKHLTILMKNMINKDNKTMIDGNYKCSANDARVLKEEYTYTRAAFSKWCPSTSDVDGFLLDSENYTLENDSVTIKLREERFLIPEALFDPSLFSKYHVLENDRYEREFFSVQELCRRTTNAIDTDDRKLDIHSSLVCIGGGLDFPCFELRLHRELRRMKLRVMKVHTGDNMKVADKKSSRRASNIISSSYSYGLYNTDTIKSNSNKRIYTSWRGACYFCHGRISEKVNTDTSISELEKKNTAYKRKHGFSRWVDKNAWNKFGSSAFYKDITPTNIYNEINRRNNGLLKKK